VIGAILRSLEIPFGIGGNVTPHPTIVLASQRRSGTHMSIDFLRSNLVGGRSHRHVDLEVVRAQGKSLDPASILPASLRGPVILKTHAWNDIDGYFGEHADDVRALFKDAIVLYACRDARPQLVSQFHYEERQLPEATTGGIGQFLRTPHTLDEWAPRRPSADDRPSFYDFHVRSWLEIPEIVCVRFEDWKERPVETLRMITEKTGLAMSNRFQDARLSGSERTLFGRAVQRLRRLTGRSSSVGLGTTGARDWRDELVGEDLRFVEEGTCESMERLGYAT
jgi:hypothetical protein